jgi:hypothetical protein
MRARHLWLVAAVIVILAAIYWRMRPEASGGAALASDPPPDVHQPAPSPPAAFPPPAVPPQPVFVPAPPRHTAGPTHVAPEATVPIQDGATIDFSTGSPQVRSGGADAEALAKALKEMAEATSNVTFPPSAPPPPVPQK